MASITALWRTGIIGERKSKCGAGSGAGWNSREGGGASQVKWRRACEEQESKTLERGKMRFESFLQTAHRTCQAIAVPEILPELEVRSKRQQVSTPEIRQQRGLRNSMILATELLLMLVLRVG